MTTYEGKSGIKVTVLADSINATGNRMITFELEYPRLILAELNTHRALSKNSFSSRAVPFEKMLNQLTGIPVRFGANQAGMQDKGEDHDALVMLGWDGLGEMPAETFQWTPQAAWGLAKGAATKWAKAFKEAGYHKQVYNRLLEPFQMMKTVLSGTELSNFFWLRDDELADPTLGELARLMRLAANLSTPRMLNPGMWHLPYIDWFMDGSKQVAWIAYVPDDLSKPIERTYLSVSDAIKVSCARCAAVSYRNEGYGLLKSTELFERLVGSDKKHASALEHCATPIAVAPAVKDGEGTLIGGRRLNMPFWPETWADGVSHVDRDGSLWSGNLKGFIQYRKLVPGENYVAS